MAERLGTIVIERPFGGWISTISGTATTSPGASLEGKENQYAYSNAISLFRLERFGHIAPGEVFSPITDSTPHITDLPLNGVVASANGFSYFVLKNARVVQTNNAGTTTTNKDDIAISGTHSGHTVASSMNPDILVIKDAQTTPIEYVVWSWEDDNDGDIAVMKSDRTGLNANWFSSLSGGGVLKKGVPLKLCQGPTGDIYGTNGQYLISATMTAGTALTSATGNAQALNLGSGWVASGITPFKDFVAACGYKPVTSSSSITRSNVRVWLWNTVSGSFPSIYEIPDNYANGIHSDGKDLFVITEGRGLSAKTWKFNGTGFDLVFQSNFVSPGGVPIQGGMENYQGSMHFVGDSKKIYQSFEGGFHHRTTATDGTNEATSIGMLKNLYQSQLFVGVGIAGGLYKVYYQDQFVEYYVNAEWRSRLVSLPYKANIKKIRLYFSQFGTGASVTISLFKNYATYSVGGANDKMNKTLTNSALGAITEWEITDNMPITSVSSFYLNLKFNHTLTTHEAAIVRRIEVDWSTNR